MVSPRTDQLWLGYQAISTLKIFYINILFMDVLIEQYIE